MPYHRSTTTHSSISTNPPKNEGWGCGQTRNGFASCVRDQQVQSNVISESSPNCIYVSFSLFTEIPKTCHRLFVFGLGFHTQRAEKEIAFYQEICVETSEEKNMWLLQILRSKMVAAGKWDMLNFSIFCLEIQQMEMWFGKSMGAVRWKKGNAEVENVVGRQY